MTLHSEGNPAAANDETQISKCDEQTSAGSSAVALFLAASQATHDDTLELLEQCISGHSVFPPTGWCEKSARAYKQSI